MKLLLRLIRRELTRYYHLLNPESRRRVAEWENQAGPDFFRKLGLGVNESVLDVGCGPGHYTIAAARVVEPGGRVFAVDHNMRVARRLKRHISARNLPQIHVVDRLDNLPPLPPFNLILLYDMLYFHKLSERQRIYEAVHARLDWDGKLSVHPKHLMDDEPAREFALRSAEALTAEIEEAGFCLDEKLALRLWHAHDMTESCVWNFTKRDKS